MADSEIDFWRKKFRDQSTVAQVNTTAQNRNPADVARARRIAKYANIPTAVAEAEPSVGERLANARYNREMLQQYPWMAKMLGEPDTAALVPKGGLTGVANIADTLNLKPKAAPKHPSLVDPRLTESSFFSTSRDVKPRGLPGVTDIESRDIGQRPTAGVEDVVAAPKRAKSLGGWSYDLTRHLFTSTAGGFLRAAAGVSQGIGDVIGTEDRPVTDWARETGQHLQTYYRPDTGGNRVGEWGIDAAQMVSDMVVGGGLAGGVRKIPLYFGLMTGSQTYGDLSARSDDKGEALAGAAISGGLEWGTEVLPTKLLGDAFGGKAVKHLVADYIAKEFLGEQVATTGQYLVDVNLADPTEQFSWKELSRQLIDTAAVTLLGGAVIGGGTRVLTRQAVREAQETNDAMQGVQGHAMLDAVMGEAEKHELRIAAPDVFAQMVQQGSETGPIRNVYVPVEAIDALLEDPALPEDERAVLSLYQSQIDEARPGNNEVVIPVGEFATRFTGTLWQRLGEDVRVQGGGMSAKEARVFQEQRVAELEKIDKAADESAVEDGETTTTETQRSSKQQVYDTVKQQMLAAGRTEKEAQTTALLAASRAENLASERYGQYPDAMAAWKDIGFTIAPAKKGARKGAARTVEQTYSPDLFFKGEKPTTFDNDNKAFGATGTRPVYPTNSPNMNSPKREWAAYYRQVADFHEKSIEWYKARAKRLGMNKARVKSINFHHQMLAEHLEKASDRAQFALENEVEDVFSSTEGDGTGQGIEGRTQFQPAAPNTDSEAFKAWFADSKVVDADGKPLVVYHATTADFDVFKTGDARNGKALGLGSYFTDDPSFASAMATDLPSERLQAGRRISDARPYDDARIIPVYLSVQNPLYHTAGMPVGDALTDYAKERGHDGIIFASGTPFREVVVFEPTQIKSAISNTGEFSRSDPRIAYQAQGVGARGKTDWFADGSTVVTLFAKADFSTMLHEMSHVFLEQEFKLAAQPGASEVLKRDVETIKKWMAANGHPVGADGVIPTEAHEMWARSGERYFREGKAPSAELRDAFAQFRTWLTGIYKSLKALQAYGPTPLNHDIRQVMDRMIATSDAINDNAIAPMSQADLGMTDAQYAAYLDSVKGAQDEAEDHLLNKMMSAIRQRETQRIAEQRRNIRDKINAEFNDQPGIRALHLLRTGKWLGEPDRDAVPVKLNTGWLIDNYGEEVLDKLPRGLPITRGDGVVGDVVAEMTGMSSGDALVQALIGLRAQSDTMRAAGDTRSLRDAYVTRAVDEAMAQRHGDVALDEAQIREEAIAALNSERQGERLATELRALKRREGKGGMVTPYQVLKAWARQKIAEGRVSEVASKAALQRYIRAHNKARNTFEEALLKGDEAEAIRQKQAQMINHALLAEGKRVADELEPIIKRMKRYADKDAMASVDQDYMDRIHALLAGFSFRPMSQKAIEERAGFRDWAAAQAESGHEVLVPPRMGDLSVRNWTETTVADLLELNDAMQSLIHLGKLKQTLQLRQQERELREFKDEARARILALPERRVPEASIGDGTMPFRQAMREANGIRDYGTAIRNVFSRWVGPNSKLGASEFVKMEGMFDILDGEQTGLGPLNQLVMQGATDAANSFSALMEEVMEPLVALYRDLPKKHRARLNDFITIPELTLRVSIDKSDEARIGQPIKISRMQHIGMLLNTGNLSNLAKMVGGEKWGDPESATDLARVRDILWSHASAEDQALVQALWDGVGSLWPHIARVERAMSGVVPEQVDAAPFAAPHGEVRGGYWPVVWDSARSQMGKQQADDAETSMFGIGTGIATEKGHTITRTGAVAPMEYGLERVLFGHLNKVISRIAYAEWVRDTLKVVDASDITGAIDLRLGETYRKQIKRWIKDQIPSSAIDPQGSKLLEKVINQARINASIGVLGISYTTGIAQTLGLGFSVGVLGEGSKTDGMWYMAKGIYATLKQFKEGPHGAQDFVFARSGEMARRAKELSVETADVFRQLRDNDNWYHKAQAMAFWHIGFIDLNTVAIPTWLGGYAKGIDQGMTEEEAAAYGDKVVRLSQGSGRAKDLAAVQRGNAGQKIIAMFYTPGSVFFNQQWTAAQNWRAGNYSKAIMPTFWFLGMTTILDAMMSGDWPDDDDEDGWIADEVPGWIARNMLFGLAFGVPVLRDIANAAERKVRDEYSTFGSTGWNIVAEGVYKGGAAAVKLSEPDAEPMNGKQLKAMIAAGGFVFGLPGNQVGKTAGFAYDASTGAVEPEGGWDWYAGLTSGKLPEKETAE